MAFTAHDLKTAFDEGREFERMRILAILEQQNPGQAKDYEKIFNPNKLGKLYSKGDSKVG